MIFLTTKRGGRHLFFCRKTILVESVLLPTAIVTRARSGLEKPKQFDDSFITPTKRKAVSPAVQAAPEAKKVKVEILTDNAGGSYHILENTGDEAAGEKNSEECKEIPSDSEEDLSAQAQAGTKLTVCLHRKHIACTVI